MTNGDKIRSMTDAELAEWLDRQHDGDRDDWKPIGCYHCINFNTHHDDKSNIGTEYEYLYECGNCEFEDGILGWIKK